ncbi:hypothetical protein I7I51_06901 [Histoplasma capsulatum]|uniref:Uncharacterized protein n=1 Tax=Ajellomyces capsulatus TaxID=5037 RepID=A0A8A1MLL6_AJECA|nr:hypothetical protein I7I51_06901 [Histoplasma capsulatum]
MFIPVESGGENGVGSFGLGGGTQNVWVVDKSDDGSVVKEKVFGGVMASSNVSDE